MYAALEAWVQQLYETLPASGVGIVVIVAIVLVFAIIITGIISALRRS